MTEEKVKKIIAQQIGVDIEKVAPEASLKEDLGGDFWGKVKLVVALEKEFGVMVSDADVGEMKKVKDVIKYIKDRKGW